MYIVPIYTYGHWHYSTIYLAECFGVSVRDLDVAREVRVDDKVAEEEGPLALDVFEQPQFPRLVMESTRVLKHIAGKHTKFNKYIPTVHLSLPLWDSCIRP